MASSTGVTITSTLTESGEKTIQDYGQITFAVSAAYPAGGLTLDFTGNPLMVTNSLAVEIGFKSTAATLPQPTYVWVPGTLVSGVYTLPKIRIVVAGAEISGTVPAAVSGDTVYYKGTWPRL